MRPITKTAVKVLAAALFLAGLVFFLQGINVLPGSYMTGDPQWAINGGIAMLAGAGLFIFTTRRKAP